MQRLKIAIVHNTVAPYRHPLFESLSQHLDLVVYYCSVKHSFRKWDLWPQNYEYKHKFLSGIHFKTSTDYVSLNPSIIREIIINKPNALILSDYTNPTVWFAFAIAKLLKIHIVYWTEGIREPLSILGRISKPLRILFVKASESIIVPGHLSKTYVLRQGAEIEKIFIASNAVDNDLFFALSKKFRLHKDELKNQMNLKDRVVILYVGQLVKRKGIEYLLQAYEKIEKEQGDATLILVGSGPLEPILKGIAADLKIRNVRFVSSGVSFSDLIKFFSISDIFVLPTLEDLWGFVINEAMVCGLLVIATQAAQAAQEMILSGENGYLVKAGDSEALYFPLKDAVSNPLKREKMCIAARNTVLRRFSISNMTAGFLAALRHCMKLKNVDFDKKDGGLKFVETT